MSECDEKWSLCVAEGYAEWHPSCSRSPLSLSFSSRLFALCILFIHASCNCITILHRQYLLSLPSDCNTIHLQADAIGFSFYMQSISLNWLLTLNLNHSRRVQILLKGSCFVIFDLHVPTCATYRKEKQQQFRPAMWTATDKERNSFLCVFMSTCIISVTSHGLWVCVFG